MDSTPASSIFTLASASERDALRFKQLSLAYCGLGAAAAAWQATSRSQHLTCLCPASQVMFLNLSGNQLRGEGLPSSAQGS
jgi:hypothetical protein